jgi:PKD repeat protein
MRKQGNYIVWLGLLFVLLSLSRSHGVLFVSTGDPTYNTSAPSGSLTNSGWQYEGQWISYLATPVASNFFIAAKHINGSIGDTFGFNGVTYHTVAFFDGPGTDLRLWQVAEAFPSYALLYTNTNEVGKHCVVFGRGTDRGSAVVVGKTTNGWEWGLTNGVQRWGDNVIAKAITSEVGALLTFAFDRKGGSNECGLSFEDSSGAVFIQDGTTWKLAGIHYSVDGPFSRDGTTNTQFQAALMDLRGLYYLSGPNTWTLVPANSPVAVPSSFYSSRISANISWIRSVLDFVPPPELQITSPPSTTNALATIDTTVVVKPGDTLAFTVGALSTNGLAIGCLWDFGDGDSTNDCNPSHAFADCGVYPVSVTLTDDVASVTTGLTVAVACPMNVSSLKLQAKFTRTGADTCSIKGALPGLPAGVSLSNVVVILDVGDAPVSFQLSAKGRGANPQGNIKLAYNKRTATWTFTGKLKGNLRDSWTNFGITSTITSSSPVTLPVVLLLQSDTTESFEIEPVLNYSNKSGTSGTATFPVK